jgi:hypothetical protein
MPHRPAQVWNGTAFEDIGDNRLITHTHAGTTNGVNIPQSSVTNLTTDLADKVAYPSGGSNGDALIKDGTAALWGTAGKILQVVRATDSTNRSTTSTSFVDATLSVTISPTKKTARF